MSVGRELVYGRQPVREVLRGRREVLELWVTERALAAEPWLQESTRPRPQVKADGVIEESAGTRDHQGVLAFCEPYRYGDALALAQGGGAGAGSGADPGAERPLIVVLDQVTDPHNLGAVCRSAEGAGATCVVIPKDGAVHVTPAVCKTSAGAVEHIPVAIVTNIARYLEEIKGPDLWVWAADQDRGTAPWQADLAGGTALVLGAEGKGLRPLVRRSCDGAIAIPLAGKVESLNVSVAAGVLLFEARRQRST
jgi:23S rRNA (guanosine2251-2'-O)-methyltransferase